MYLADAPEWGSSPLTRGAPATSTPPCSSSRLIPAHAGSTKIPEHCLRLARAHPRSRGEHGRSALTGAASLGSSPLTRGARPTCGLRPRMKRAHPRSRGEHVLCNTQMVPQTGSSPLTRGAPPVPGEPRKPHGLIPAHAGSTRLPPRSWSSLRAHPRSRGEHLARTTGRSLSRGSSPLTRGALLSSPIPRRMPGLIPAHAGSTMISWRVGVLIGAHPRSRGEHLLEEPLAGSNSGSSPLTRGAHPSVLRLVALPGLIPAHAGSTGP